MVDQHVARTGGATPHAPVLGPGSLPPGPPPANEGRTVAAWTTTAVIVLGAIVTAVGLAVSLPALGWVGVGVVVLGVVVGGVLRALGLGQPVPHVDRTQR